MGFKQRFALSLQCSLAATDALVRSQQLFDIKNYRIKKGLARPIKIVCLADLHDREFGAENAVLLAAVAAAAPDVIVLSGDTVSAGAQKLDRTCKFLKKLCGIAPVFSNLGNHEQRFGKKDEIAAAFSESGVRVLQNEIAALELQGQQVHILGLCERQALSRKDYLLQMAGALRYENHDDLLAALAQKKGVRLVLSHFPENFAAIGKNSYCRHAFEVMFSGHAHGGQIRLPKIGGIYAPGQGILPIYDRGVFRCGKSRLIVSGGLGNDGPLPRINNRPELVVVTLV